jgi:hypothetical protein
VDSATLGVIWSLFVDYTAVAFFGGAVGLSELIARYRDEPWSAIRNKPAYLYIAINALAAVLALSLIRVFGWTFWANAKDPLQIRWAQILVAGFTSMALFRSSLFTVRVGDQDVGVGPSSLLQVVLGAADREVDRIRAESRATAVAEAMADVSFVRANVALPTLCMALMQNLSRDDQEAVGRQVDLLRTAPFDDGLKTLTLGLYLMNVIGEDVLLSAVKSLGPQIHNVSKLEVKPDPMTLQTGNSERLIAQALDTQGHVIPVASVSWTSRNPAVATVDATGLVAALSVGSTVIEAQLDGLRTSARVAVQ